MTYVNLLFSLIHIAFAQVESQADGGELRHLSQPMMDVRVVYDYRAFAKIQTVRTETPVAVDVEDWRSLYALQEADLRDLAFRSYEHLTGWQLEGLEDRNVTPRLHLTYASMRDLRESILRFSHRTTQQELFLAVATRLREAQSRSELVPPALHASWEEELLVPLDVHMTNPPEDLETVLGILQFSRTLQRAPGRVVIRTRVTLTKDASMAELPATLTALEEAPAMEPLSFEVDFLEPLRKNGSVAVLEELKQASLDPQRRTWALIMRAAAFREMGLPKLALALLDDALSHDPTNADLLRARLMSADLQPNTPEWSRSRTVTSLEALLAQNPLDAAQLKVTLAHCLSQAQSDDRPPSTQELKRATVLLTTAELPIWREDLLEVIVSQGAFAELAGLLADRTIWFPNRPALQLVVLAGLQQGEELAQMMRELSPMQGQALVTKAYELLYRGNQLAALDLLAQRASSWLTSDQQQTIAGGLAQASRTFDEMDPNGVYRQWFQAIAQGDGDALDRLVYPGSLAVDRGHFEVAYNVARGEAGPKWPFAVEEGRLEGDAVTGYRLELGRHTLYFAKAEDHLRIVAVNEVGYLTSAYALELIERHQLEAAYRWLDWTYGAPAARKAMIHIKTNDLFWSGTTPRTANSATLAAQAVMALGPAREQALLALLEVYPTQTGEVRDRLGIFLLQSAAALGERIKATTFTASGESLELERNLDSLRCLVQGLCTDQAFEAGDSPDAWYRRLTQAQQKGGYPAVLERCQAAAQAGLPNELISSVLLNSALREAEVPHIPEAWVPAHATEAEWLIYRAELGQVGDVVSALTDPATNLSDASEYYLSGRMAECFGEPQLAATLYRAVTPALPFFEQLDPSYNLAQRRLQRLASASQP